MLGANRSDLIGAAVDLRPSERAERDLSVAAPARELCRVGNDPALRRLDGEPVQRAFEQTGFRRDGPGLAAVRLDADGGVDLADAQGDAVLEGVREEGLLDVGPPRRVSPLNVHVARHLGASIWPMSIFPKAREAAMINVRVLLVAALITVDGVGEVQAQATAPAMPSAASALQATLPPFKPLPPSEIAKLKSSMVPEDDSGDDQTLEDMFLRRSSIGTMTNPWLQDLPRHAEWASHPCLRCYAVSR